MISYDLFCFVSFEAQFTSFLFASNLFLETEVKDSIWPEINTKNPFPNLITHQRLHLKGSGMFIKYY